MKSSRFIGDDMQSAATSFRRRPESRQLTEPHVVGRHTYGFARCAALLDELDSGLRRNDGSKMCM